MKYKKFLNTLRTDTSLEDLWAYYLGIIPMDYRQGTKEQRKELITKILPKLIIKTDKENTEESKKYWYNAPIFRLGYIYCLNNKIPVSKMIEELLKRSPIQIRKIFKELNFQQQSLIGIFEISKEIIDRTGKDDKGVAVRQRLIEYIKRTKDTELL